jgi:hypothetical protein
VWLVLPYCLLQQFREELSCRLRPRPTTLADSAPPHAKTSTTANTNATAVAAATAAAAAAGDEPAPQQEYSFLEKLRALVAAFKPAYWQALAVAAAVYFTRFDAAFLGLRAKQVGG